MSEYTTIRDFFDDIRSSFQKLFGLLDDDEYNTTDSIIGESSSPKMYNFTPTKFSMDYSKTIAYFIITFVILIMGKEVGLGTSSVTFLGLAVTYTMLSTSITSSSTLFILLEIIAWTCIIELLNQIDFKQSSWFLVLIIPIITIMQSLFYLLFYLM
jgi:hypothetical protein